MPKSVKVTTGKDCDDVVAFSDLDNAAVHMLESGEFKDASCMDVYFDDGDELYDNYAGGDEVRLTEVFVSEKC